jgi:hypothetical protein
MSVVETVVVVRKDHPDGKVEINKSDLTDKDVIWSDKPVPKAPKKAK